MQPIDLAKRHSLEACGQIDWHIVSLWLNEFAKEACRRLDETPGAGAGSESPAASPNGVLPETTPAPSASGASSKKVPGGVVKGSGV